MKCYNIDIMILSRDMGELDEVASLAERGALMYRQVDERGDWDLICFNHMNHTTLFDADKKVGCWCYGWYETNPKHMDDLNQLLHIYSQNTK